MNPITWLGRQLEAGWFSRALVVFQLWFCYFIVDWSMSFASTALAAIAQATPAAPKSIDLLAVAANIAAVAAIPQALLMLATKSYMELRAQQPIVVADRRKADA